MKQTTIRFFGSLKENFPEIADNAAQMAAGDLNYWIDEGLQVSKSIGKLVCKCMHKRDMILRENDFERINDLRENQEQQLEREMLMKLNSKIREIQDEFEKSKATLSQQYCSDFGYIIKKAKIHQKLQQSKHDTCEKLQSLLEEYSLFLEKIKNDDNYSEEIMDCEEMQRRLYGLINEQIDQSFYTTQKKENGGKNMSIDTTAILKAASAAGKAASAAAPYVEKGIEFAMDRSSRKEKYAEEKLDREVSRQIKKSESTVNNINSVFHTLLGVSAEVRNVFVEISKGKQWDKEFELKVEEIKRQHERNMKELENECKKIDREFDEKKRETQNIHDENMLNLKSSYDVINKTIDAQIQVINRLLDNLSQEMKKGQNSELVLSLLNTLYNYQTEMSKIAVSRSTI